VHWYIVHNYASTISSWLKALWHYFGALTIDVFLSERGKERERESERLTGAKNQCCPSYNSELVAFVHSNKYIRGGKYLSIRVTTWFCLRIGNDGDAMICPFYVDGDAMRFLFLSTHTPHPCLSSVPFSSLFLCNVAVYQSPEPSF
jgi:hypothetical protein